MSKIIKPDGIPAARARLRLIITRLQMDAGFKRSDAIAELEAVHEMLFRRSPVRKARVKARRITEDQKRQVRELAARHPNMHMNEIGALVGLNQGRVSEILNGLR